MKTKYEPAGLNRYPVNGSVNETVLIYERAAVSRSKLGFCDDCWPPCFTPPPAAETNSGHRVEKCKLDSVKCSHGVDTL